MPTLTQQEKILGPQPHKRLGLSFGCGSAFCGFTRCGFENIFGGIYAKHYIWGKPVYLKRHFHWPKYARNEAQDISRTKFAEAVSLWHTLTTEQKNEYRILAKKRRITGFNFFISQYLLSA
jgi:hypothetical protein